MRAIGLLLLLMAGALLGRSAAAQSLDHPYPLSVGWISDNTCSYSQQQGIYIQDTGYWLNGPYVVYDAVNLLALPPHHSLIQAWNIDEYTQQYQTVDLSVWVCSARYGDNLGNCIDGSDNFPESPNLVEVPAQPGYFYVVVATGIRNSYPQCGGYTLIVSH